MATKNERECLKGEQNVEKDKKARKKCKGDEEEIDWCKDLLQNKMQM